MNLVKRKKRKKILFSQNSVSENISFKIQVKLRHFMIYRNWICCYQTSLPGINEKLNPKTSGKKLDLKEEIKSTKNINKW